MGWYTVIAKLIVENSKSNFFPFVKPSKLIISAKSCWRIPLPLNSSRLQLLIYRFYRWLSVGEPYSSECTCQQLLDSVGIDQVNADLVRWKIIIKINDKSNMCLIRKWSLFAHFAILTWLILTLMSEMVMPLEPSGVSNSLFLSFPYICCLCYTILMHI